MRRKECRALKTPGNDCRFVRKRLARGAIMISRIMVQQTENCDFIDSLRAYGRRK